MPLSSLDPMQTSIPKAAQLHHELAAFLLEPKIVNLAVVKEQVPFIGVAMLKDPPSAKVMLAHRSLERVNRLRNERVFLLELAKGQMESFFVPVKMPIIKI